MAKAGVNRRRASPRAHDTPLHCHVLRFGLRVILTSVIPTDILPNLKMDPDVLANGSLTELIRARGCATEPAAGFPSRNSCG